MHIILKIRSCMAGGLHIKRGSRFFFGVNKAKEHEVVDRILVSIVIFNL